MKTKDKILNYIKNPLLIILSLGYRGFFKWIPDEPYLKLIFHCKMGYWPDLKNPKTFNEKLQWLKLHDHNPLYTQLVDKYEVRKYVEKTIGKEHLVELLGVWNNFDEIDFNKLPNQFVLKCTHDSGGLVICKDKLKLNIEAARRKINHCLKKNYYWGFREWPYKNIKPRIIAEKYMVDESKYELKDYKIFCFNGKAKYLFIATDRGNHQTKFDFFDTQFKHLSIRQHYLNNKKIKFQRPDNFDEMLAYAEKLTQGMIHCRADFYNVNGQIYVGELTFSHFSGLEAFDPSDWDLEIGKSVNLCI